jgi:hypothetical protein
LSQMFETSGKRVIEETKENGNDKA